MLNKERVQSMIYLAMLEQDYGSRIKEGLPARRRYVNSRLVSFFIWESLLYLIVCVLIFVGLFIVNYFSMPPMQSMIIMIVVLAVVYVVITYVGLLLIRRFSIRKHKKLSRRRKMYMEELERLNDIYENETEVN